MRTANDRILSSFDWFVLIVILGYVVVVAQELTRGGMHWLPFAPSSQLWYDGVLPPTELPDGSAVSMGNRSPIRPVIHHGGGAHPAGRASAVASGPRVFVCDSSAQERFLAQG